MRYAERCKGVALVTILGIPLLVAASDSIPIDSVAAFNTQCARCHEAECSGRMSFDLAADAADEHFRRHGGGPLPLTTVRDLGALLRYMKERCAFYPRPLALANDHKWGNDTPDRLRDAKGTACFLPLP